MMFPLIIMLLWIGSPDSGVHCNLVFIGFCFQTLNCTVHRHLLTKVHLVHALVQATSSLHYWQKSAHTVMDNVWLQ